MKKHPVRTALRLAFALALSAAPALQAREKPQPADVLIWPQARRAVEFRQMEKVFPHARVVRSSHPAPLLRGDLIAPRIILDGQFVPVGQFMARDQSVGLLVLQNGRIRLEAYADGFRPGDHWAGFSLTKSVSSALIGAAIRDGRIGGLDDAVTHYLPGLTGSAYDGVKLRHLLSMTSGAAWSENYLDPASDVARMYSTPADPGFDPIVSYMRHLKRASPPGSQWLYKTGETDLVGMLLIQATGEPLANYLSRRIWQKIGMESDGWWMINERKDSPGGCCLSASLRDWGRFGEFIRRGGMVGGQALLDPAYLRAATSAQIATGRAGQSYGYLWWINADGSYDARGIFGQLIHIDPRRNMVVVALAAWDTPGDGAHAARRAALLSAIEAAVDGR